MRFVIVTGMSGAGKSTALKILEDAGYFCVDNLPVPLILKFAEISGKYPEGGSWSRCAKRRRDGRSGKSAGRDPADRT